VLGDEPEKEWQGEIDQVFFGARSLENEVVFFHRASRTLICADMIFNLAHHPSRFTRIVAFCWATGSGRHAGGAGPDPEPPAARAQVDRMLVWKPDRIVSLTATSSRPMGARCCAGPTPGCRSRHVVEALLCLRDLVREPRARPDREQLGYERAWFYDSPALYPDVWSSSAVPPSAPAASASARVLVPSLRHPMVNAAAIATLVSIAGEDRVAVASGRASRDG